MSNRTNRAGCMLSWALGSMAVMAGALLIVDRALTAVEELAGPWFYAAVIGLEIVGLAIVVIGGAVAIVRWLRSGRGWCIPTGTRRFTHMCG